MKELTQRWNQFVESLVATKNAWDTLAELMRERPVTDSYPNPVQKIMSFATVKRGAKFDVAMPRLLDHMRRYGGYENLHVVVSEEPLEEPISKPVKKPEAKPLIEVLEDVIISDDVEIMEIRPEYKEEDDART